MINFRLIRHLWLFQAVAEEEHFGRAAKRLGMSQPPLTEQIQALEQALKVRLFERNRRGARLTPVGAAILPAIRKLAEQLERLEFAVREAVAGQTGTLTIGAINAAIVNELPPLIQHLRGAYPQLTVSVREIDSVEAVPALVAGDIDIAFARLDGDLGPDIHTHLMAEDCLAVVLPQGHPLAGLPQVPLRKLAHEDLTMAARRGSPVYFDHIMAACRAHGFSPRIMHEVRSVTSQIALVGCGQGIAIVPSSFEPLATANVAFRPLAETIRIISMALVWSSARHNPLVEEIVRIVSDTSTALGDPGP